MESYAGGKCPSLIWIKQIEKSKRVLVDIINFLHNCKLFSEVRPTGFRWLATIARLCHFRKGQVVFRENGSCPGFYVVGQNPLWLIRSRYFFAGICMMTSAWAEIVFSVIVASRSNPRNQFNGGAR